MPERAGFETDSGQTPVFPAKGLKGHGEKKGGPTPEKGREEVSGRAPKALQEPRSPAPRGTSNQATTRYLVMWLPLPVSV